MDLDVGVIYGSIREGRTCDLVARWTVDQLEQTGTFKPQVIDPAELDLPISQGRDKHPAVTELTAMLARCDAFVIVTPEYNHSFPAAVKMVVDHAYTEWQAKPVGFVSYGGVSGGLRAVEQLRLVFAELSAVTTRTTVGLPQVWTQFDSEGKLLKPAPFERAMKQMLKELEWWGRVLKAGREGRPYAAVA
ncbi:MAG TPA: NAD(P)H-dependent oxidoreductase [Bryobacteraceae bacterium]|nr:NAD(P)H-dependent oxidoreductase [Bryobacteraceae bacterium]